MFFYFQLIVIVHIPKHKHETMWLKLRWWQEVSVPQTNVNIIASFKTLSEMSPETQQQVRLSERQSSLAPLKRELPDEGLTFLSAFPSVNTDSGASKSHSPDHCQRSVKWGQMRVKPLMTLEDVALETCCSPQQAPDTQHSCGSSQQAALNLLPETGIFLLSSSEPLPWGVKPW